ncbi:uncharacterized protein At2g33490-like [Phalaenopsis equestris]|uniref:uncharacterized protein At2g33490-like n=1 Tax=Phalaenopsis equestris TaxID=78828 RepID=UPI0009E3EB3A|nr:uncharacterized protein At2g33490-like [Phalaenopsis equestris]
MKSSLRKLRGFALHKSADLKEKRDHGIPARQDELLQASQDVLDMRNCYDSLLSAAAATANSAYEFSEALREMGTCLLEKTSLNDDEESGKVLLMLGKVQFELQKLVDSYRVHIIQTITTPSESLLKELHTVEEMKRQCDDKRDLYKFMLAAHREKGRARHAKGEGFSMQQLQAAREDYEEEANLFVFRLKSLKQGQSRSLLTQAARHHASQLNFFKKGVKSLEIVEPHVKSVAEQWHIDYDFIGLEEDDSEDGEDNDFCYDENEDSELSFDYGQNEHFQGLGSTNRNSVEEVLEQNHGEFPSFVRGTISSSQSAPILSDKKHEPSEGIKQIHASSPRKLHTYVLPTPLDPKSPPFLGSRASLSETIQDNKAGWPKQLWHSSPLETNKPAKNLKDEQSSPIKLPGPHSVLKESNINGGPIKLPPPLPSISQSGASETKFTKRQAFSGPLMSKNWGNNQRLATSEYVQSVDYPSGPSLSQGRIQSAKSLSPSASPLPIFSPKINELHELPRPPICHTNPARPSALVGHSGPLMLRGQGIYAANRMLSNTASPLPTPPPVMARSFSIPSNGRRSGTLTGSTSLEAVLIQEVHEEPSFSPPLTRISLSNTRPFAKGLGLVAQGMMLNVELSFCLSMEDLHTCLLIDAGHL